MLSRITAGVIGLGVAAIPHPAVASTQAATPQSAVQEAPRAIDDLWTAFDERYAAFPDKQVPWGTVRDVYRARAAATTSQRELFDLATEMLALLNDNHVKLTGWTGIMSAGGSLRGAGAAADFSMELIRDKYLEGEVEEGAGGRVTFGWLPDSIGYVHVAAMYDQDTTVDVFEEALSRFAGARGLVLDLRVNLGGAHEVGQALTSLMADQPRRYMVTRLKHGPGRHDFTGPRDWILTPPPAGGYARPVVVLTNQRTFSAGETFLLALRVLPHVTTLGTPTAGAMGETENEVLASGWVYRTDMQRTLDADGRSWAGSGIPPDLHVRNTAQEIDRGRDRVLEAGIGLLSSGAGAGAAPGDVAGDSSLSFRLPLADSLVVWIDQQGWRPAMARFRRARADTSTWSLVEDWEAGDLVTLGNRLLDGGDVDAALAVLEVAIVAYPESYRPVYKIAEAYERLGRWDEAAAARKRALTLNRGLFKFDRRVATELRGRIPLAHLFYDWVFDVDWVSEDGVAGAVRRYRILAAERPRDVEVDSLLILQIGQQLREARQLDDAEAVFRFVTEEFPQWTMGYIGLAAIATNRGHRDSAREAYDRVLELDPGNRLAREGLATLNGPGE